MAKRPDWDKHKREENVRLRGKLPFWQDGWSYENAEERPREDNYTITFECPGLTKWIGGKERTVYKLEMVLTGISYVAWGYIMHPVFSIPKSAGQAENQRRIDSMIRRLGEKVRLAESSFLDGVLKEIYRPK
jgi:hypothetical protein